MTGLAAVHVVFERGGYRALAELRIMSVADLKQVLSAHPVDASPYNRIIYVRSHNNGTPLYRVQNDTRDVGADEALREALRRFGGSCFYCGQEMSRALSHDATRDHLRPKHSGGRNILHNLVLACGKCNRDKGGKPLSEYHQQKSSEYLTALDEHLTRCVQALMNAAQKPNP